MIVSAIQKEIVDTSGNMIVSASAGTGKTHTMTAKITKEIEDNHTHKVIAAITFTVKAAKEIRNRLTIDIAEHFIGTNNSFAIEEIIKPFARDVYGNNYDIEVSTDYSVKKETFLECLDYLKTEKIICSYKDNKKNFVFELALKIVQKSRACQLYLKSKYFKIYVDEYQDCDQTMHEFFMYLCNKLDIELFVVGDEKQSIYIWRGAYPDAFKSIMNMNNFKKKRLIDNYRSCQQIQNYSYMLNDDTRILYKKVDDTSSIMLINSTSGQWFNDIIPYLDLKKKTVLLRFSNYNAKDGAKKLSNVGTEFIYVPKTPISDITTNVLWLYNAIAQYFILPKYSVYDFIDEIPEDSIGDRKIQKFVKSQLDKIEVALSEKDEYSIINVTSEIASFFGYQTSEDNIKKMISTILEKEYHPAFHMDELSHVAMTFHSSKGMEYEQVVVFANDYPLNNADSIYNHYVAVTRAKNKLIIVKIKDDQVLNGENFTRNLEALFAKSGVSLKDVMTII